MNNTPTPRTDTLFNEIEPEFCDMSAWDYFCEMTALATELETKLAAVTEQRDRLAEALERIGEEDGSPMSMRVCSTKSLVKQALQSLNPDHTVDSNDMIPAVKG